MTGVIGEERKSLNVGSTRTPKMAESSGALSTSTFAKMTFDAYSSDILANTGAARRHGGHQCA